MRGRIAGTALATLILIASAYGDAIFHFGGVPGHAPVTGTSGNSMTIFGRTSNGLRVEFSSTMDSLIGASSIPIITNANGVIHNLTISVPDFSFETIEITPVALAHNTITVSALMLEPDGKETTVTCPIRPGACPFGLTNPASPRFTIEATHGERILSITVSTTTPVGFREMRQVYFSSGLGEFKPIPVPTPEPSALEGLLLGMGILGFAGMTSRKLKLGT
jgi:hypothetical protein